ncbi:helix-turn-helix domain-containing protein [Blautia sp. TF11-31AT]|nr:helix-turn-helix domain-containing protein [Blautia sp. TF11-31AT]
MEIYSLLKEDKSIRKIAKELNRDPTTIAKEIKKHFYRYPICHLPSASA